MASSKRGSDGWGKIGAWTRMHQLGSGGFGTIYLGKRTSDEKVFAVKSTYFVPHGSDPKDVIVSARQKLIEENALSSLINEIRTLRKLKSPYIVRYLGCGTSTGPSEMGGRLLLDCYMEYLPWGSLDDLMTPLAEPFIQAYTKDILRALLYLHFNKLVHGDLKCSNVLTGSTHCRLADFGSVKDVRTSFFSKILFGTRGFKAPEVEIYREQTYASDIFSLGCTVQEMATTASEPQPINWPAAGAAAGSTPSIDPIKNLSHNLVDFVSKCLAPDPRARWTASDLLKHPFITEPSSPRWKPYDFPPPVVPGDHKGIIVPPNDLDLDSLPSAPFSPIPVVLMKRRKLNLGCVSTVDESEVLLPGPPPWLPSSPASSTLASDRRSDTHKVPPFKLNSPSSRRKEAQANGGLSRAAQEAIKRLSLAPRVVLEEMQNKKSVVESTVYRGYKVEFPSAVARLTADDTDEDKSPLVVKICSEFDIPLPPEYQKWILDPDYDPNAPPPLVNTLRDTLSRAVARMSPKSP